MADRECCKHEAVQYALYNMFKVPKLYRLAGNGDWDMIPQRCKAHPKEACFVHAFAPSDTALHRLLRTATTGSMVDLDDATRAHIEQLMLRAVSALLLANHDAASTQDAFGRTPLHIACMDAEHCGETVASMLLDARPNAASKQDVEGRTPLHYLVGRNDVVPMTLLTKLISVFPKALEIQDNASETPLKLVTSRQDEIQHGTQVLELLKAQTPESLQQQQQQQPPEEPAVVSRHSSLGIARPTDMTNRAQTT